MDKIKIPLQYKSEILEAKRVFLNVSKTGKWEKPSDLAVVNILTRQGHVKSLSHSTYAKTGRLFAPTKKGKNVFGFI